MTDFLNRYRIQPGKPTDLNQIDTRDTGPFSSRSEAEAFTEAAIQKIQQLQYELHVENKQSLLVILQGLDASGKDGLVRKVFGRMNPQGCRAYPFKAPTSTELAHDFLWRIHARAPAAGMVSIFNRSHYEDVLAVRVEKLAPAKVWKRRFDHINAFESLLADHGTRIIKLYLHISLEEQLRRFESRLDDPEKHWKLNTSDYQARLSWDGYREAYHDVFQKCSPEHAPWFVIPADRKWHRNAATAGIVLETLQQMNPQLPDVDVDIAQMRRLYEFAKQELESSKEND